MNKAAISKTYPKTQIGRTFVQERMTNFYKKINGAKPVINTNIRKACLVDMTSARYIQLQTTCEKLSSRNNGLGNKHNCVPSENLTFKPQILRTSVESKLLQSDCYQAATKKHEDVVIEETDENLIIYHVEIFDDVGACLTNLFTLPEESDRSKDNDFVQKPSFDNTIFTSRHRNYGTTFCYSKYEQMLDSHTTGGNEATSNTKNDIGKDNMKKDKKYSSNKVFTNTYTCPQSLILSDISSYQLNNSDFTNYEPHSLPSINEKCERYVNDDMLSRSDTSETIDLNMSVDNRSFFFLKDLTEDILGNGIFSDSHLKKIIQKHIRENKYNLDLYTLKRKTDSLMLMFGIPLDDERYRCSKPTKSNHCSDLDETIHAVDKLNISKKLKGDIMNSLGLDSSRNYDFGMRDFSKIVRNPQGVEIESSGIGINGLIETLNSIEERFCNLYKLQCT